MKNTHSAIAIIGILFLSGCAGQDDLGPLTNYYHDCTGSHGHHQSYVRKTLRLALAGNQQALHTVFSDKDNFGTGDNEAYSELPGILLESVGDTRYSDFVASQPAPIQTEALGLSPDQIPNFTRTYPKTSKLFMLGFPEKNAKSNHTLHPTALRAGC